MKTQAYYQQGDVILIPIEALPAGLQKQEGLKVQLGETTGHSHKFVDADLAEIFFDPAQVPDTARITPAEAKFVFIKGGKEIQLLHEEHKPLSVPPGIYKVDIVREYDYDKEETRRVVD